MVISDTLLRKRTSLKLKTKTENDIALTTEESHFIKSLSSFESLTVVEEEDVWIEKKTIPEIMESIFREAEAIGKLSSGREEQKNVETQFKSCALPKDLPD